LLVDQIVVVDFDVIDEPSGDSRPIGHDLFLAGRHVGGSRLDCIAPFRTFSARPSPSPSPSSRALLIRHVGRVGRVGSEVEIGIFERGVSL
jgi:hypothetical protein